MGAKKKKLIPIKKRDISVTKREEEERQHWMAHSSDVINKRHEGNKLIDIPKADEDFDVPMNELSQITDDLGLSSDSELDEQPFQEVRRSKRKSLNAVSNVSVMPTDKKTCTPKVAMTIPDKILTHTVERIMIQKSELPRSMEMRTLSQSAVIVAENIMLIIICVKKKPQTKPVDTHERADRSNVRQNECPVVNQQSTPINVWEERRKKFAQRSRNGDTLENDTKKKDNCIESLKKEQEEQKYDSGETMETHEINEITQEKMGKEATEKTTDDELDNPAECSDVSRPILKDSENCRQLIMYYLRNYNDYTLSSDILPKQEFRVKRRNTLDDVPEKSGEEDDDCEDSVLPYVAKEEFYFPREPLKITTLAKEEKSHLIQQIEPYTHDRPYHVTLGCSENPTKEEVEERYKQITKSWIQMYGKFETSEYGNWRLDDSGALLGKLTDAYLYLRSSEEHRRLISLAMKLNKYTMAAAWGYLAKEHWVVDEEKMVSELNEKTDTLENEDSKENDKAQAENMLKQINELNEKLDTLENNIKEKDKCIESLENEQKYNSGEIVMYNEEIMRLKEKDVKNEKAIEELEVIIEIMNNFY
ncbi:interaptin-like [Palaemon carinicauda]|uniref:interaptin-like n=1 Tax=Palaemon carinicauda TaxID=392227 RepID=UPI0035B63BFA